MPLLTPLFKASYKAQLFPASMSFLLALVAVLGLTACSSRTVVESDLGIADAPAWVNEGKQAFKDGDKRFFRGIGSAPAMGDVSLQKTTADNRARAELAQIFSSYMDVVAADYTASAASQEDYLSEATVTRTIENTTKLNLVGVQIIANWKDPKNGTIYSLAELDASKLKFAKKIAEDDAFKAYIESQSGNLFDKFVSEQ